eukprot:tig00000076_g2330.t1
MDAPGRSPSAPLRDLALWLATLAVCSVVVGLLDRWVGIGSSAPASLAMPAATLACFFVTLFLTFRAIPAAARPASEPAPPAAVPARIPAPDVDRPARVAELPKLPKPPSAPAPAAAEVIDLEMEEVAADPDATQDMQVEAAAPSPAEARAAAATGANQPQQAEDSSGGSRRGAWLTKYGWSSLLASLRLAAGAQHETASPPGLAKAAWHPDEFYGAGPPFEATLRFPWPAPGGPPKLFRGLGPSKDAAKAAAARAACEWLDQLARLLLLPLPVLIVAHRLDSQGRLRPCPSTGPSKPPFAARPSASASASVGEKRNRSGGPAAAAAGEEEEAPGAPENGVLKEEEESGQEGQGEGGEEGPPRSRRRLAEADDDDDSSTTTRGSPPPPPAGPTSADFDAGTEREAGHRERETGSPARGSPTAPRSFRGFFSQPVVGCAWFRGRG